ncbi:succinylglutamate desuccinylase/aspartoacylase family protein [Sphingomicrobium clamense]|uniref:Succinylglutamate desuccinylase/aspartoacylase family protein n=1 Tax=Sphingomicrobium clamense TaxID=2851013 RepID=A0ABS6V5K0_9SPHN|nr:succinylglutamate desuccinylase/aspartoacylase family protein [Sphingomicrobium sp. B8]MBW0144353.1 succinylglutamate desuccinylase/aspartoacylase family protein [Sphingomicrobium sp. B8]
MNASPFKVHQTTVAPGKRASIDIPVSRDAADSVVSLPVRVIHGKKEGPVLFVSAAVHGDEISGVEVARRLIKKVSPARLSGTLIVVPVVNAYGFVAGSRYLPDRRDLNRSFPGRPDGPLASRLAYLFRTEIMEKADFGIDLHSAAAHRYNLPQIRVSSESERALELARAFAPPVIMTSKLRDGSMRAFAHEIGVEMLVFEAGEALRFDKRSTRVGVNGVLRTMQAMGMLSLRKPKRPPHPTLEAHRSMWLRAPRGGIAAIRAESGRIVKEGAVLAVVRNPVGDEEDVIKSPIDGIVIGHSRLGVVNRGDAMIHLAQIGDTDTLLDPETEEWFTGVMLDEHEVM